MISVQMGKGFKHHRLRRSSYTHTFKSTHVFIKCPFCGRPFDRNKVDLNAVPIIEAKVKRLGGYRCIEWLRMGLDKASIDLLKSMFVAKAKQIIAVFGAPEKELEVVRAVPIMVEITRTMPYKTFYASNREYETRFRGVRG
jgi:hypothetical protein